MGYRSARKTEREMPKNMLKKIMTWQILTLAFYVVFEWFCFGAVFVLSRLPIEGIQRFSLSDAREKRMAAHLESDYWDAALGWTTPVRGCDIPVSSDSKFRMIGFGDSFMERWPVSDLCGREVKVDGTKKPLSSF